MAAFISLPHARIHRKNKTKNLNNLLSDFEETCYKYWLEVIDFSFDSYFQRKIVSEALNEDIKNFLFANSESGQEIQREIDWYITNGRLNEALTHLEKDN